MTTNLRKPGLLYPSQTTLALPSPVPFTTRFRPAPRRPALRPTTRELRRAARAAELAAWEAATPNAQLRAHAHAAVQDTPAEKRAFALLAILAGAGILWGAASMFQLVERWPAFVATMRQLAG